jgi:hypothetical protein
MRTPVAESVETLQPDAGVSEQPAAGCPALVDLSFIFIAVCCGLFSLCVSLKLNGSSSAFWAEDLQANEEATGLILGRPKMTRSDEWMVWTPAALAQLHHVPSMPIENSALGAGASPLLMSVPVRHYSMFFRPQFWGFFLFDIERGFAWFWNTKIFLLLVSFFLLLRMLLKRQLVLAILGSIAVSYSSYVQWFFSSPTMLPEMLAAWALMLVAGRSLFDRGSSLKKAGVVVLLSLSAINFVLCCYPPFQIPLVYLALMLFGGFVWKRRTRSFQGGFLWCAGALIIIAAILWPLFIECRPTLEVIAQTSYPGARRTSGGAMSFAQLFSGLLNFFDQDRLNPEMFPNSSEASNFFPIWVPVMGGLLWSLWKGRSAGETRIAACAGSQLACIALMTFIAFFSLYAVVGLPEWICRMTALNFCTEKRALLAIGIAGLILTFLTLRMDGIALVTGRTRIFIPIAIGSAVGMYVWCVRPDNALYLTPRYCFLLITTGTLLGSLYFCARPVVFGGCFAGVLLLNNFLVNPVSTGIPILLQSMAARRIAAIHSSDPAAAWAAYERGTAAQFAIAAGARVLNGVKTVPDLTFLRRLDPAGESSDIYNRYAFIELNLPPPGHPTALFKPLAEDSYQLFVSPFDEAMKEAGLKYVIFPRLLDKDEIGTLKLIAVLPANLIWIYKIDR